ncbi:MAG: hypothetical protein CL666_07965 [Balneola sp.]|nr:hypothetical protein [Balneola sp.]
MDELNKPESVTRIAKGTRVKADIHTESDIHIAGTVEGDIETSKDLVISEGGKMTGAVIANGASISGKFTGELRVLNHISLSKTALVDGFIFSKSISVDEDAKLIGILNVGDEVDVMNAKLRKVKKRAIQPKKETPEKKKHSKDSEQKELAIEDPEPQKPHQNRYLKKVLIGIPGSVDSNKAEDIRTACEKFMNALGFKLEIFDEPDVNPFYQNLSYTRMSPESTQDIQKKFEKSKEIIESALLNNENTETEGSELQKASNEIVRVIREFEEFTLILGEVVLLQFLENDVQTIACEIVPDTLQEKIKTSPDLIVNPSKVYKFIDNN